MTSKPLWGCVTSAITPFKGYRRGVGSKTHQPRTPVTSTTTVIPDLHKLTRHPELSFDMPYAAVPKKTMKGSGIPDQLLENRKQWEKEFAKLNWRQQAKMLGAGKKRKRTKRVKKTTYADAALRGFGMAETLGNAFNRVITKLPGMVDRAVTFAENHPQFMQQLPGMISNIPSMFQRANQYIQTGQPIPQTLMTGFQQMQPYIQQYIPQRYQSSFNNAMQGIQQYQNMYNQASNMYQQMAQPSYNQYYY